MQKPELSEEARKAAEKVSEWADENKLDIEISPKGVKMSPRKTRSQRIEDAFQRGVETLKDKGCLKAIKFYYLRDANGHPVGTVAIAQGENGKVHRAVSICSPLDSPRKRTGRKLAIERLRRVVYLEEDIIHSLSRGSAVALKKCLHTSLSRLMRIKSRKFYLGCYDTEATDIEKKILGIK